MVRSLGFWDIRSHRTTRLADHGNGTPEVVLRTHAANVVKNGTMYWGSDRYILKRAAAPESIPDPLDPARDRPDWTVDVALHVADNIQPLPSGSVVISGMMPDPQKPQGAELPERKAPRGRGARRARGRCGLRHDEQLEAGALRSEAMMWCNSWH